MSKVALITGAGRGLGAYLARQLAGKGFTVAVHYHSSLKGAKEVVAQIRKGGGTAAAFRADLRRERDARELVRKVIQSFKHLDVVINNAGLYQPGNVYKLSEADWFEGLHTTATACFFTTRAAIPFLRSSRTGGRVINIGDSSCDRTGARDLALSYHIGKTGVLMMTRSFAQSEAAHRVTVNMISPGYLENSLDLPSKKVVPAGRFGTFNDIWQGVDFFLREESGYITGSNLIVSGGWNLR